MCCDDDDGVRFPTCEWLFSSCARDARDAFYWIFLSKIAIYNINIRYTRMIDWLAATATFQRTAQATELGTVSWNLRSISFRGVGADWETPFHPIELHWFWINLKNFFLLIKYLLITRLYVIVDWKRRCFNFERGKKFKICLYISFFYFKTSIFTREEPA